MVKHLCTIILMFTVLFSKAQVVDVAMKDKSREFRNPVLVKLIRGEGNVFRIGFVKGEANKPDIQANFMKDYNLKGKVFVYFPLSNGNGEMLIVERSDVTKMEMTYENAMELINPNR